jgi:UDP-N-acetyl-D-galactosamine dehydrogenase
VPDIASLAPAADRRIAVIGLGYVGLPLAVAFGRARPVTGFDISEARIAALGAGRDATREVTADELAAARGLHATSDPADLAACDTYIVTVPTPIDTHKRPDLTPLLRASETVGRALAPGDLVIYESTVYPGATEEDCVPVLERVSGLVFNRDFFVGYSPERINPGDRTHRLPDIRKVTAGSTPEAAEVVDTLYAAIITAGTYRAESIRVAEAAKVIENTQRDLNIALVNELAMIFNRMGLDTQAVLEAAGTKWNFLPFRPGLVGGHCIGVDPYYLTHKAEEIGHRPEIILAGRRINDGMGAWVAGRMVKAMLRRRLPVDGARVLVMGLAFKENCPDLRNTRVVDVIAELRDYGVAVDVHDPWVDAAEARAEYGLDLVSDPQPAGYDGIMLCVAHDTFRALGAEGIRAFGRPGHVLYDLKHILPRDAACLRL